MQNDKKRNMCNIVNFFLEENRMLEKCAKLCYNKKNSFGGGFRMKHIKTINAANLKATAAKGGCGKCQASCQSACKTSCTVANQKCEH